MILRLRVERRLHGDQQSRIEDLTIIERSWAFNVKLKDAIGIDEG